ncbi:MAG: type II toxin-antitoxin system HicA family toxin [Chloroflexota bacterium]
MARWTPCKRRVFIRKLTALGFSPPEPGGRHSYMRYGSQTLTIPNNAEYSVPQLKILLKQVEQCLGREVSLEEWRNLGK